MKSYAFDSVSGILRNCFAFSLKARFKENNGVAEEIDGECFAQILQLIVTFDKKM